MQVILHTSKPFLPICIMYSQKIHVIIISFENTKSITIVTLEIIENINDKKIKMHVKLRTS